MFHGKTDLAAQHLLISNIWHVHTNMKHPLRGTHGDERGGVGVGKRGNQETGFALTGQKILEKKKQTRK